VGGWRNSSYERIILIGYDKIGIIQLNKDDAGCEVKVEVAVQ